MREPYNLCPNAATYNAPTDACAGRDLYDSGMMLLEEMVDAGMP